MQSPRIDEQQQPTAAHLSAGWHDQGSELIKAHSPERMVQVGCGYCHATAIPHAVPADCTSVLPTDQHHLQRRSVAVQRLPSRQQQKAKYSSCLMQARGHTELCNAAAPETPLSAWRHCM